MGKIKSRKFQVWIITTILAIASVVYTKELLPEIVNMYMIVSMLYIGSNTAQKYIMKEK